MPRVVEYPRASLDRALHLAGAIYELGGRCSIETCADKMGMKVGGGFLAIISAADKFGLIKNQKGQLSCTELFVQFKHAYSEEEETQILRSAFLTSGVFSDLYRRFRGRSVPEDILDKILVREFGVPSQGASRISKYFIDGARVAGLFGPDNKLIEDNESGPLEQPELDLGVEDGESTEKQEEEGFGPDGYEVRFLGPGLNTRIKISEPDDLQIVNAILAKITKRLEKEESLK